MAKIPEYGRQVNPAGPVDMPRATGANLGAALDTIGKAVSSVSSDLIQFQQKKQDYESKLNFLSDQNEMDVYLDQASKNAKEDGSGFTEDIVSKWNDIKQKRLDESGSQYQRQNYELMYTNGLGDYTRKAQGYEAQLYGQYTKDQFEKTSNEANNLVRANPNLLEDKLLSTSELIDTMPGDTTIKNKFKNQIHTELYDSALDGKVTSLTTRPTTTLGQVNTLIAEMKNSESPWIKNVSKEKYDAQLSKLQGLSRMASDKAINGSKQDFEEEMARISRIGFDPKNEKERYNLNYINNGPFSKSQKESMTRLYEESMAKGITRHEIQGMTFQEASQYLSEAEYVRKSKEDPANFNVYKAKYETGKKVLADMQEDFKKDPIAYTKVAYPAMDDMMSTFSRMQAQGEAKPEDTKAYVESMEEYQRKVNPWAAPRIVSKEDTGQLAYLLSSSGMSENGARIAYGATLKEAQKWGQYWPQVLKDYKQDKVFDSVSGVASGIIDQPLKLGYVEDAFKASKLSKEKLNALYGGGLSDDEIKNQSRSALESFIKSQALTSDGPEIGADYMETVTTMTKYYGGSKSPKEIAEIFVNDQYEFIDSGTKTIRVPKQTTIFAKDATGKVVSVPYSPSKSTVEEASGNILKSVHSFDIVSPKSLYGIKAEDEDKIYKDRVYERGMLVNDGDSGIRLVDPNGGQVYRRDGKSSPKPLKWNWIELNSFKNSYVKPDTSVTPFANMQQLGM